VIVFIGTSPFRKNDEQYGNSITVPLIQPNGDTLVLVDAAIAGLRRIWRQGYRYAKAGVMLMELQPQELRQGVLDLESPSLARYRGVGMHGNTQLMTAVDGLNRRYGRGSVVLASAGVQSKPGAWVMKQQRRTPQYTTSREELPLVRA
jgi:DNA polymerase V